MEAAPQTRGSCKRVRGCSGCALTVAAGQNHKRILDVPDALDGRRRFSEAHIAPDLCLDAVTIVVISIPAATATATTAIATIFGGDSNSHPPQIIRQASCRQPKQRHLLRTRLRHGRRSVLPRHGRRRRPRIGKSLGEELGVAAEAAQLAQGATARWGRRGRAGPRFGWVQ